MTRRFSVGFVLASLSLGALLGSSSTSVPEESVAAPPVAESSGVITLYAGSDVRSTVNLDSGTYGSRVVDGTLDLDDTHLAWNLFETDMLSVGYVRQTGVGLVDLGTAFSRPLRDPLALSPRFGASIFHTLAIQRGDVVYTEPPGRRQRSPRGRSVVSGTPKAGVTHFKPVVGNIYLLRVRGFARPKTDVTYKFRVIDLQPGHTLTLEYGRLARFMDGAG